MLDQVNARGAQENLWPKFFLWSAPLRATSSANGKAPPLPFHKLLKRLGRPSTGLQSAG